MATEGHWKLNDNDTNNVVLDSLNNYEGTATQLTIFMTIPDGKINRALWFDGSHYITTGLSYPGNGPRSISFWSRTIYSPYMIMAYGNEEFGGKSFRIVSSGNNIGLDVSWENTFWNSQYFNDGNWHHYVLIFPVGGVTMGDVIVYEDNVLLSGGTGSFPIDTNNGTFIIGADDLGWPGRQFVGDLDDVRFYGYQITPSDVAFIWNGGNGTEAELGGPVVRSGPQPCFFKT